MSARVFDLDERRPARKPSCTCRPDSLCYPHRLTNLAAELRAELEAMDELLVDLATVDRLAARVFEVIDGIAAECLPTNERTAK